MATRVHSSGIGGARPAYLVFAFDCCGDHREARVAIPGLEIELWRPSMMRLIPPGPRQAPLFLWWLLHHARAFANRDYSALIIRDGRRVVHRSMIFPRYFAFPFMEAGDLQVGNTWTAPDYRGKGLATTAIRAVMERRWRDGRRIWYVASATNTASLAVAHGAGLVPVGRAMRRSRGVRALGGYSLAGDIDSTS
jgi:RimJ/RimL family protein N-acetyltransferase